MTNDVPPPGDDEPRGREQVWVCANAAGGVGPYCDEEHPDAHGSEFCGWRDAFAERLREEALHVTHAGTPTMLREAADHIEALLAPSAAPALPPGVTPCDLYRRPRDIIEARAAAAMDPPALEFHVQILTRDFWVPQRAFAADLFHRDPDRYRVPVDFRLREGYLPQLVSDSDGSWL